MKVAALFVETNGVYYGLEDVDPWDEKRDARLYPGPDPVIAHPPCARWCKLAPVNEARYGHKRGDDGGCFLSGLENVRTYGGVLEHPASSYAWPEFGLKRPIRGQWSASDTPGEWVCEVSQRCYGHRAQKKTWLLYVGDSRPPDLDWSLPDGPKCWISCDRPMAEMRALGIEMMSKKERSRTPIPFRDLLLNMARMCRTKERIAA